MLYNTKKIFLLIPIIIYGFSVWSQEIIWVKETWGDQLQPGIAIDEFNNFYITDDYSFEQTFDGTTLPVDGNANMFLIKYSPDGQIIWTINSSTTGDARGMGVSVLNENEIYFSGIFYNDIQIQGFSLDANNTSANGYYGKANEEGNLLWLKKIASPSNSWFTYSLIGADDYIIMTGRFRYPITFDNQTINGQNGPGAGYKSCISKFNSEGEIQWIYDFFGTSNLFQVKLDHDNNILFGGEFQNYLIYGSDTIYSEGYSDVFFGKLDSSGELLWIKTISGPGYEYFKSIENTQDNQCVILCIVNNTSHLDSVYLDYPDSSYLLMKLSGDGEMNWHLTPPKLNDLITVYTPNVVIDPENNPVLFARNYYFILSPLYEEIEIGTIKQNFDINTGQILSQRLYPNIPMPQHIISSPDNHYYFYNQYYEEVTIDSLSFYCDYYGSYIGKMNDILYTPTTSIDHENSFIIYPNPTIGIIDILPKPVDSSVQYSIFDTNGKLVMKSSSNIDITHLQTGIYILRIAQNTNTFSCRILKY